MNIKCNKNLDITKTWSPKKKESPGFVVTYGTEGDFEYTDEMAVYKAIEMLNSHFF